MLQDGEEALTIRGNRITRAYLRQMLLDSVTGDETTPRVNKPSTYNEIGIETWKDYMKHVNGPQTQLHYPRGHAGLGINISNFGGDGTCYITGTKTEDGLWECIKVYTPAHEGDINTSDEHYIGEIGIDAGEFLISDPCYLFPNF